MIRHHLLILLLYATLASGTGCQVLSIPSYRADGPAAWDESYAGYDAQCQPGILPPAMPVPTCLANWRKKQRIPQPPAYPRFHPLPTRPMFSPPEMHGADSPTGQTANPSAAYGHWPPAIEGGPAAANAAQLEQGSQVPNRAPDAATGQMHGSEDVLTAPQPSDN